MRINIKNFRTWFVSLLYALWLAGMTLVFYLEKGVAGVGLQLALFAGCIPVAAQMLLIKMKLRDIKIPIIFTCIFIILIISSLLTNMTDYYMFVSIFNILFVFSVAIIIASCSDDRIIALLASGYAVFSSAILIMVNLTGAFVWGRLYTDGIHANYWGLIALSVGVTAFALKSRILAGACWCVVFVTLYNTSSRGSMVALFVSFMLVAAIWFIETKRKKVAWYLTALALCLLSIIAAFDLLPHAFTSFVSQDLLRLDQKDRGLGSGLTGRTDAWLETLEVWMANPVFGVGFRQHEDLLTTASSAHNAYLAMLADTGLFGLIAYVLLISLSFWAAWRRDMPLRLRAVLLAIIASYAVLGLFERRALNAGNSYSILFVICCYYSLRSRQDKPSHKAVGRHWK